MSSVVLSFNNCPIRDRGEMLNLTDMWKAAGGDPSQRPTKWLEQDGTQSFRAHLESVLMTDTLLESTKGREGSTWAHWQLGMAYAKYLSHEFHAWCNEVVRAHMVGRHGAPTTNAALDRIAACTEAVTRAIGSLSEGHAALATEVKGLRGDVTVIQEKLELVAGLSGYKRIPERTRREHIEYIRSRGGRCPCCAIAELFDDAGAFTGEVDHYYANYRVKPHEVWPVCKSCHNKKTHSANWPAEVSCEFNGYQSQFARRVGPLFSSFKLVV